MRTGPVDRVRAELRLELGDHVARAIPHGYQRVGRVVVLRLPDSLRPHFGRIGRAWLREPGVSTVLQRSAPVHGDWRLPPTETIGGDGGETEVVEYGVRYRFDASRILFAQGNKSERHRAGLVTKAGDTVVDLFAGIGYFAIPAAKIGGADRVYACEANPISCEYLRENIRINEVESVVRVIQGDNRRVELDPGAADRVFLGLLPSSLPWIPQALSLLRPAGGTLHVHLVTGVREEDGRAKTRVAEAIERTGGRTESLRIREVKAYGPGRRHVVVDARARPPSEG